MEDDYSSAKATSAGRCCFCRLPSFGSLANEELCWYRSPSHKTQPYSVEEKVSESEELYKMAAGVGEGHSFQRLCS